MQGQAAARSPLRSAADALKPGGIYVLGFHLSDRGLSRERWIAKAGSEQVVCNIQSWPPDASSRVERVRSRLIIRPARGSGPERRSETTWEFRTYDEDEVCSMPAAVPQLEHVATFDFTYRGDQELAFDGEPLDVVPILRRVGR